MISGALEHNECTVLYLQNNAIYWQQKNESSNSNRNNIFNKLNPKRQSFPSTSLHAYITLCIKNTYATFHMLDRAGNAQKQRE